MGRYLPLKRNENHDSEELQTNTILHRTFKSKLNNSVFHPTPRDPFPYSPFQGPNALPNLIPLLHLFTRLTRFPTPGNLAHRQVLHRLGIVVGIAAIVFESIYKTDGLHSRCFLSLVLAKRLLERGRRGAVGLGAEAGFALAEGDGGGCCYIECRCGYSDGDRGGGCVWCAVLGRAVAAAFGWGRGACWRYFTACVADFLADASERWGCAVAKWSTCRGRGRLGLLDTWY
jgi:hypothetical protein